MAGRPIRRRARGWRRMGAVPRCDSGAQVAAEVAAAASYGRICPDSLRVDSLPEAPECGLVDSRGRLDGGPRYISCHKPLDGSHLPLQLPFPAAFPAALAAPSLDHFLLRNSSPLLRGPARSSATPQKTASGALPAASPARTPRAWSLPRTPWRGTAPRSTASPIPATPAALPETSPSSRSATVAPRPRPSPIPRPAPSGRSADARTSAPSATVAARPLPSPQTPARTPTAARPDRIPAAPAAATALHLHGSGATAATPARSSPAAVAAATGPASTDARAARIPVPASRYPSAPPNTAYRRENAPRRIGDSRRPESTPPSASAGVLRYRAGTWPSARTAAAGAPRRTIPRRAREPVRDRADPGGGAQRRRRARR